MPVCDNCEGQEFETKISHSEKNPNRAFYSCSDCANFCGWVDQPKKVSSQGKRKASSSSSSKQNNRAKSAPYPSKNSNRDFEITLILKCEAWEKLAECGTLLLNELRPRSSKETVLPQENESDPE